MQVVEALRAVLQKGEEWKLGVAGAVAAASEGSEDEDSAELMEYISELCSNMAISMNEILTEVSNLTRQRMSILILGVFCERRIAYLLFKYYM